MKKILDFIKNELIEIIQWVEEDNDTMLWKFPDKDYEVKNGAQLVVRESQVAILINEGQIADIYGPGTHTLSTQNMPILSTIKGWKYGFESPFKVDVYYISTKQFTDLKWGTTNPVMMRDPEFKFVRVKAHGSYFIKVRDAAQFFREFAGTARELKIGTVEERLRDIVSPKFAEALGEANISVLDIVSNYTEIGDQVKPVLQSDLDPFGIELTKFQITSTTMPKEVEEFYDKMTGMNMVGDMSKYQQFQAANAMEKAAENESGGAGEGLGMGMGFGMAQQMMQNSNMQQQQAQQQPPAQASQPTMTRDEIMNTLKELGELKTAGILTDDEFNAKKKELLARL